MTEYGDLNVVFEQQLRLTARFVRAAFHVHSIDSHDWGKEADARLNDRGKFEGREGQIRYLDALAGAGLELVCVTDHMRCGYAFELSALAASREDITVLPGMEISCSIPPGHREGVHILVVYPPDASPDVIERLFSDQPDLVGAGQRTGQERVRFESLAEIRRRVHDAHGLFLLAHIDQYPRGHRCYVRSVRGETARMFAIDENGAEHVRDISHEYADHLAELDPHAVEVKSSEDRAHYWDFVTTDGVRHGYACVARSDHHALESMADPQAITYVKVSRRDIDCLRDAMLFPETRIRFADDLPEKPSPRLVGLRLRGGGLFTDATIAFNENLNCLIGPRGCGKSTIIEALRYVLGQRPLLEDPAASGGDDRSFAALAIATQRANLVDSEIELIYEQQGARQVLAATYDSSQAVATRVFTLDGEDRRVAPEALQAAYPARIFSWSELETLGRQPRLQRLVVDRLAPDLPSLQERELELQRDLGANRAAVQETLQKLSHLRAQEQGALGRWSEHKTAYEQLNTEEVSALFGDLDRERDRIRVLSAIAEQLTSVHEDTERLVSGDLNARVATLIADEAGSLRDWWSSELEPALRLPALAAALQQHAAAIAEEIRARRDAIAQRLSDAEQRVAAHEVAIREQTNATPGTAVRRDQREQARQRFEAASAIRERYLSAFAELEAQLSQRGQALGHLDSAGQAVTDARVAIAAGLGGRLAEVGGGGPAITITVEPRGDRTALARHLDETFLSLERGGHFHARGLAGRLALLSPPALVHAILAGDQRELVQAEHLTDEEAQRLLGAFEVFSEDHDAGVTRVSGELLELLELQEQPVEDLVTIESDGQPVDKLSPGGRSSAMLPLIALSDDVPLIIDQPEDNLDNRMVGQTLSSILAKLKEHRQIIVTTHNPNIVVGGDAEQVVVLDAPSDRSARVETTGNIDRPEVIDAVIKIMEGGREAFEERSRRYRDRLRT